MPKVTNISSKKILNSLGDWTIDVTIELDGKYKGSISIPHGKSAGAFEAHTVETGQAIKNIDEKIKDQVIGLKGENQEDLDMLLLDLDGTTQKSNLGANAILGVSLAAAKAVSVSRNIPFWQYLRELYGASPDSRASENIKLLMCFVEGGSHAGNDLDFQEYLVIPKGKNNADSVMKGARLYKALGKYIEEHLGRRSINVGDEGGYAPLLEDNQEPFRIIKSVAEKEGLIDEIEFGADIAANNVNIETEELFSIYRSVKSEVALAYLEDPFKEDDFDNFNKILKEFSGSSQGEGVMITGDDLTTTNTIRMGIAHKKESINSIIIKPNQIGTLSEMLKAVHMARAWNWKIICSHRGGETNDDFITDIAYAIGADGLKVGGPARGERVAKYNRLLEISS